MAKRPVQTNTLFSYFSSPKLKTTPNKITENGFSSESKNTPTIKKGSISKIGDENDSDEEIQRPAKRQRVALIDSDSESENESPNKRKSILANTSSKKHKIQSSDDESSEEEPSTSPKKKASDSSNSQKSLIHSFGYTKSEETIEIKEKDEPIKIKKPKSKSNGDTNLDTSWVHENLDFMKPGKIRDAQKRKPSDPDYDPRTLYVPPDYLDSLTPAVRQWWILKSQNMDAVLFFKVGKFYELYHMDAVVGVQQLGFTYMKGDFAHSGFPETAYGKMATMLLDKGFKVARIEQTETPEMMADRCKQLRKPTKYDKVVAREICQVTTKASCVYGAQMPEPRSEIGTYLYAVSAKVNLDNTCRFGICFIETSIGTFHISEFDDDKHCSKLLAVFAEYPPGLILTERGASYGPFKNLLNTHLKEVMQEILASKTQFCSGAVILEKLFSECYFKDKNGKFSWPKLFSEIAEECNPKPEYELALRSLGAVHWFLKNSLLDIQLFSMGLFEKFEPIDLKTGPYTKHVDRDYMVLDSTTIENLSLLGGKGTLQKTLDFCKTPFGKRLLPLWICRPLCNIEKINLRQDAVKELFDNPQKLQACQEVLKKLPDLERQVAKIHTYGNRFCATNHPDSRAILYEAKTYSKRKIMDLLKTLRGFEASQEVSSIFKGCDSRLLRKLTQFAPDGMNVDLKKTLDFFKQAFNHAAAEKEGTIIPQKGVDDDYDDVENTIEEINRELQEYLKEQCRFFGCQVTYHGNDKKRFQLEIPDHKAGRAGEEYQLEGQKKGAKPAKRFSTATTKELLQRLLKAEAERAKIILDLNRRIFEKFSQRYEQWQQVVHCLAMLDVICSLAEYASTFSGDICKPEVEPFSFAPFISIENGKHPCVSNIENFVPNDTYMGSNELAPLLLLTGPNMGGKSTLMRQVSIICIMAQMGSFVPASQCSLSLIDRVFTRLGAFDDIVRGQSTFFVELSEASTILRHASQQSLLIIDELGRGTSTHDGMCPHGETFYNDLTNILRRLPKNDFTISMGDFNAKVGEGQFEELIGPFGLGERNERLMEFVVEEQFIVTNTFLNFPRRLYTWKSPQGTPGNAIATAYVRKLMQFGCRTLFSTHYHTLVDHFVDVPEVQLGHMACMVENDENPTEESVTLLYKLAEGRCPKSFGFNAAKLAGLPTKIVSRARQLSKEVEEEDKCRHVFSQIFGQTVSIDDIRKLIAGLEV